MQFKNPEILYFLALLIIPILVHLFQLQKFVKTAFTNVAFLQKLVQQTRKSSRVKKWLLLAIRMLLFLAIIFAFSQPYFSNKNNSEKQQIFIYLDNSLSTNSTGEKGDLLQIAAQEIIENTSEKFVYSLQTNSDFYKNISKYKLKKILLKTTNTSKKLDLTTVFLKIKEHNKNKTNTLRKNILISDFQNTYNNEFTNVTPAFSAIKLTSLKKNNISIDSVFINNVNATNFTVNIVIKNQGAKQNNIPIAIYNNTTLISKQSFSINKDTKKTVQFTIKNQSIFLGKIALNFSDIYSFDNVFYFTFKNNKKINVLAIGNNNNYLSKIYTKDEFNFTNSTLQNTNYNRISKQQLIVLNELKNIPEILTNCLLTFSKNGGHIAIIPNKNLETYSYNSFLSKLNIGKITPQINDTLKITTINYEHPLFKNVFSKKVSNFQYPNVKNYYPISSKKSSTIISYENNSPFLLQVKNTNAGLIYWFSSAISKKNSNFLYSPLIVPVFYNFGKLSFKHSQMYYRNSEENKIDIETTLNKDEILSISNNKTSFIPLQQTYQNKVTIITDNQPLSAGFHTILKEKDTIETLAFNYPKEESSLKFLDLKEVALKYKNSSIASSIKDVFKEIDKKNEVQWLWKWFLALAIVSLLLEILILKFYKP